MKVFVVAIPFFDSEMAVEAYRLCDREGDKMLGIGNDFRRMNEIFLAPGLDVVERIGVEAFTGGKRLFIDVNKYQLIAGVPTEMNLRPGQLVVVVPSEMEVDDIIYEKCERLKNLGIYWRFRGCRRMQQKIGSYRW
ncbi:MAG: hypothetical protein ACOYJB_02410 [Christensenellaceae bacterium]|jgi:c-di-GMP-related signal transduction protein